MTGRRERRTKKMRGRHMKMKTGWSGWGYMAILYHFINRGTQNTDTLLNTLKYSGTTMNNRAGLMHANPAVMLDEQTYISTKKNIQHWAHQA